MTPEELYEAGGEVPMLDASWLRVLHVLAVNGIGFHSLAVVFDRWQGWSLSAQFATADMMERAGAALGLDLTDGSRHTLSRKGVVLGMPIRCWCWTGRQKTTEQSVAPAGSGRSKPRGYVNAPAPTGQSDLLDLLAVTS